MTALDLPAEFLERMRGLLGAETPEFLAALSAPESGLRVNRLRLSPTDFAARSPFPVRALPFPEDGFTVDRGVRAGRHPYHAAGLYYLQDPGAMMVGALVNAEPGERVLDLAAAPGGKATQLAAAMANTGVLVANDVSPARAGELARNLERCGVRNAVVTCESVDRLASQFGAFFDRVLLDAPCSGESMFHKSRTALEEWSVAAVAGCSRRQTELLQSSADLVRPGGLLVYSTCTFGREENEEVVEAFLARRRDFEPGILPPMSGVVPVNIGRGTAGSGGPTAPAAYRLWPHRTPGAGHFVAVLRRVDGPVEGVRHAPSIERAPRDVRARLSEFLHEVSPELPLDQDRVVVFGTAVHELPDTTLPLRGLRLVWPGTELGSVRGRRFVPAHALALLPDAGADPSLVDLSIDDPRLAAYLSGHPIDSGGAEGWVRVSVDGFALGWGKRVGSTVKNHYPKGLRRPP